MLEVLRQEKKYLISLDKYYSLSRHFANVLQEDEHSSGDGYFIRSLYFDSLDDIDFEGKIEGAEVRRKIRLRNYGSASTSAKLEMKQKQGIWQKKRSLTLDRDKSMRLINGDYTMLLSCDSNFASECFGIMHMQCYRPKAVVSYTRKVFVGKENEIRITFDHHIKGTESNFDIFDPNLAEFPILDPFLVVMEVKYNGFLLSYIKDLIRDCNESERSLSKYCLSRSISKYYGLS
ncbi:MAG: polyphosphate polymerase domain-containing protein [Defluviitaleaceae bacterium]|nr:polyphosphate polymerase domain-containing protein [Defluviitaleaceae bacterium]